MKNVTRLLVLSTLAVHLGGCSTDCSRYDPSTDNNLFKAAGGLHSKCYAQNVDAQRIQRNELLRTTSDLERRNAEITADLTRARQRNAILSERVAKARMEVIAIEREVSALRNNTDTAARKADIERRIRILEDEIEALTKADVKAEDDKREFERQRNELRREADRLIRVFRAFGK